MNLYDGVLSFHGTWRTYQQRVLDRASVYLKDKKIHIVAAPGSGKTTLGIELIRRLGAPCLILSPSITIRQQWLERLSSGFLLKGQHPEDWFSNQIRDPKPITAITYQALHCCMKQYCGVLKEEEDEEQEETVDFTDFHLYEVLKETGISTICLDEAHHLRSEWWKALEELVSHMPDATLISLTATPPYDSTPAQWKRYLDLCGPIDEEIFTPELVREGSLCAHQDYLYFNWPAKEELQAVQDFADHAGACVAELSADPEFARLVATHQGLLNPESYGEIFLENPKYFSSLLIFLHAKGISFSPYLKALTGTTEKLPKLTPEWLEALLQGFLYDDVDSYAADQVFREQWITRLKACGCIQKNKVCLVKNNAISRLLINSRGKLNSIAAIANAESESLGSNLRMLILCDYIKKEQLTLLSDETKPIQEIGTVPVFALLYRAGLSGMGLGILSGSVVVIPDTAREPLETLLAECGQTASFSPLYETGYLRVTVKGNQHHIVSMITELFTRGHIRILIGTKSLLGEGWDSPCINSLILATFVGSFMLSNQMRGRAIRTMPGVPDKTSNIWHLVCIPPRFQSLEVVSEDLETLKRRFDSFLGVSYTEPVIENGLERILPETDFSSARKVEAINKRMLKEAADRKGLLNRWQETLSCIPPSHTVEEVEQIDASLADPGYLFFNAIAGQLICAFMGLLFFFLEYPLYSAFGNSMLSILLYAGCFLCILLFCRYGFRLAAMATPQKRMKQMAQALLDALQSLGLLESDTPCRVVVENSGDILVFLYLKGGTTRDKTLFAACLEEFFGVIDNPRYLLVQKKGKKKIQEYFAVPEVFGKRKEDAEIFLHAMKKALGPYGLVYTRTPEGRKILLKARTHSFVNKNEKIISGKKQMKGKYE